MLLKKIISNTKIILCFSAAAISAFISFYIIYDYSRNLPDYIQLKQYYPPCTTRVYSSDGKLIAEYARENRIFVSINAIPQPLIEAFIAAEDKNFYHHAGVDILSIIRALLKNISYIIHHGGVEGGSTITQQVVKNFLLSSERSLKRKVKEAILSYRVSKCFTKNEILELYLNQIYFGEGTYGVASATLNYFNKSVTYGKKARCLALFTAIATFFWYFKEFPVILLGRTFPCSLIN